MTHETGTRIPSEGWQALFEELNRAYRGQRAQVATQLSGGGWRTVAGDEPFGGVSVSDEEGGAVVIELGGGLSFSAGVPQQVRVERAVGGPGQTITVVQADGRATALRLAGGAPRSAAGAAGEGDVAGVGGSAGAAGGEAAGAPGSAAGMAGQVSSGSSDDMGGVASPPSGSLGDRDLSGRRRYDITADVYDAPISIVKAGPAAGHHLLRADVVDGGSDQGVLDRGIDPIAGGPLVPGTDDDDGMVEGEVGAQAEGELPERSEQPGEDAPDEK